jgi:DNA polymerase elongation subunit (family B)
MTIWVISENGQRLKLIDKFQPKIFVAGKEEDLQKLTDQLVGSKSVAAWQFTQKYANLADAEKSKVLEIDISDCRRTPHFGRKILRLGNYEKFQLGNVDVPEAQAYLYDRDIFPLAFMEIQAEDKKLTYHLLDSVESEDYAIPPLRIVWISVEVAKAGKFPTFNDPISRIVLKGDGKEFAIDKGDEQEKLLALVKAIREMDPDIVFTHGGDSNLFPYLARRALVKGVLNEFVLGREEIPLRAKHKHGMTFFSYGRVYFKAPMRRLYGRIHIDIDNTFIYRDCGLEGLIEVARTCRVPLHRAARASIGTIMSSLQLYQAVKDDIMIPWKKREPETFKSAWELLVADRGGFIFEPKIGVHDWVGEIDFASMYPTLMANRNISAETVLCSCCPDSKLRVPELDYNICQKRVGIVPKTLRLVLKKRADYKQMRNEARDSRVREICDRRQNALKWILVTCFGYLGYKNARFGKVDAHIAVCAFARDALLKTAHLAEERGFEIVHGIVDSLWLRKEEAPAQEYIELCKDISKEIGVPITFDGQYRWIVFLPSRMHEGVPVLNRYYGVFENGKVKVRGIEARRRDTPNFVREAQLNMIGTLGKAVDSKGFTARLPEALNILKGCVKKVVDEEVDVQDLFIAKQLSMNPSEYAHNVFQAIAAFQLANEGIEVSAGQTIRYLITEAESTKLNRRVKAAELVDENTHYDVKKYLELLLSAGANVLSPFGYTTEKLYGMIVHNEKQVALN